jgi:hypothetical protein
MATQSWFRTLFTRQPRTARKDRVRFRPRLEALEQRWLPSTNTFVNGTLSIRNPVHDLTLTQTAANTFAVADSGVRSAAPSFTHVSNIVIDSGNGTHNTTIKLNGFTYTGSLTINQHNGNDSVVLGGGSILGNTSILTATGNDTVTLDGTNFGGNVTLANPSGVESVLLAPLAPVSVGASLSITGAASVQQVAKQLTVGGSTTIHNLYTNGLKTPSISSVALGGAGGAVWFTTRSLTISFLTGPDKLTLQNTTVNGNTTITLASGNVLNNDAFSVSGSTFNGSFTFTAVGSDSVTLDSSTTINGPASFNAGPGNDSLTLAATVNGTLSVTVGDGNDTIVVSSAPSGTLFLNAGNGSDSVTLGGAGANGSWTVTFVFGTGTDTLTLNGTSGSISGSIVSQNPGGNVFHQGTWIIVQPWSSSF